jgi:hypothetical protein
MTTDNKHPKTVTDFDGHVRNIKDYQKSLMDYPSLVHKVMADDGSTHLVGITLRTQKCGCEIVGCGTLQFPVTIKYCPLHSAAPDMLEALKEAESRLEHGDFYKTSPLLIPLMKQIKAAIYNAEKK